MLNGLLYCLTSTSNKRNKRDLDFDWLGGPARSPTRVVVALLLIAAPCRSVSIEPLRPTALTVVPAGAILALGGVIACTIKGPRRG